MDRTSQDLLSERRANVLELWAESDPMAREMLAAHIVIIDCELQTRETDR